MAAMSRFRLIRAYWATFKVVAVYLFLFLARKILPEKARDILTLKIHRLASRIIIATILNLKGLYIKIGQTLSIMTNFLPPEFTVGLEQLQDAVPPQPYSLIEKRFVEDFGKTPREVFTSFNETPIASASLAQVHKATLTDGRVVAVKLQYPFITGIVKKDLKAIKKIFGVIDFFLPNYGFKNIYNECADIITQELDFETEGRNLELIQKNFIGDDRFYFPKIYWEHSSQHVLTSEFIDGIKITNTEALKNIGINLHEIAINLINGTCKQIFIDGVYHADPHPGNIFIIPSDAGKFKIALLDFGATARVTPEIRSGMTQFVEGLIKKDTRVLSAAMKQMGFIAREENEEAFDKIVDYFYSKIRAIKIEDFREIKITQFQHLNDIFELQKMDLSFKDITQSFHVPKEWILLERAMILTLGLVTHLDPQLNPVDIVLPYVEESVLGKDKSLTDMILMGTKDLLTSYINLPHEIHKTLKKLHEGKITFIDRGRKEQTETLYTAAHQIIYTLLLIASGTFSYILHEKGSFELSGRLEYLSYGLMGMLSLSFLRNRK